MAVNTFWGSALSSTMERLRISGLSEQFKEMFHLAEVIPMSANVHSDVGKNMTKI